MKAKKILKGAQVVNDSILMFNIEFSNVIAVLFRPKEKSLYLFSLFWKIFGLSMNQLWCEG